MDQIKLSGLIDARLGGTFFIDTMNFLNWGQEIRFNCRYVSPESGDAVNFEMRFKDCRDLQWRAYAHLNSTDSLTPPPAVLVNLRLGTGQHHKPFQMLTDAFAITVTYGELLVQKI